MAGRDSKRTRVAAVTALLGGLLYAQEVEPRRVEVRPVELRLPRLAPEFDGYRLVRFGDIHLDNWSKPECLHRIVDKVNEQRPDLVAGIDDAMEGKIRLRTRPRQGARPARDADEAYPARSAIPLAIRDAWAPQASPTPRATSPRVPVQPRTRIAAVPP